MGLVIGATFSSTKWGRLPLPDVVIDRINSFDDVIAYERRRMDDLQSPLIDSVELLILIMA